MAQATEFHHLTSGVTNDAHQAVIETQFLDDDGNPVDITGGSAPTAPADGSITTAKLADKAVTAAKLADGVIPAAPTWANLSGKPAPAAAIPDLAGDADLAATVAAVNKLLAAARGFGVVAK